MEPQEKKVPTFGDYKVGETFRGIPAPVNSRSHRWAREFRTVIREGARKGPNFAGHFTVVSWGCGSNCKVFVIVDARSGYVYVPGYPDNQPVGALGFKFELGSRLLIVDPIEALESVDLGSILRFQNSQYYVWENNQLKLIQTLSPQHLEIQK